MTHHCHKAGPRIRENPHMTRRNPSACNWSGPGDQRTRHHGQRHMVQPHQQVEDMAASPTRQCQPITPLLTERRPDRVDCRHRPKRVENGHKLEPHS